jgi:8-oxo-dGTP pyrophosphatase MutT (NUDIX family)
MRDEDNHQANPWTTIRSENKFDCSYFTARSDTVSYRGRQARQYNHLHMKHFAVAVVPIDNDGYTTLVGQYRYPMKCFTWELPRGGGRLDAPPIEGAKKELYEETGYRADYWLELFAAAAASPGTFNEIAPCFVAWGLHEGEPQPEPEESISQRRIPFGDAISMALSGEIADLASIASILGLQAKFLRDELPHDLAKLLSGGSR